MEHKFLTESELADQLQVPRKTLQYHRYAGIGVPFVKFGRHVRYDTRDVEAYVNSHRRSNGEKDASNQTR